ncbi:hypothetical protein RB2362 [Rhodopirellula baltica SH 1]|uniref:Uncharacterized protein n=1 Tax=Rhodopirellula baltica (strain DSM 10527 / NCIMB 13988 / SH1) TaxID=243090 RepID=Q7UVY8_RHOBA|nr:hypothetical protein RB2362 [Rhodopirellula baltica SH 1]
MNEASSQTHDASTGSRRNRNDVKQHAFNLPMRLLAIEGRSPRSPTLGSMKPGLSRRGTPIESCPPIRCACEASLAQLVAPPFQLVG